MYLILYYIQSLLKAKTTKTLLLQTPGTGLFFKTRLLKFSHQNMIYSWESSQGLLQPPPPCTGMIGYKTRAGLVRVDNLILADVRN